eukprot:9407150-Pyramimonas_sp.AAC.1
MCDSVRAVAEKFAGDEVLSHVLNALQQNEGTWSAVTACVAAKSDDGLQMIVEAVGKDFAAYVASLPECVREAVETTKPKWVGQEGAR